MSNKELLQQNNSKYASLIELLRNKAINGGGSILLQEKTITPSTSSQNVTPDSGYDGLSKVTVNAIPTATQATPSISVSSGGLITASSIQSAGYVTNGTKSATKQLTVQAAKTITPSTSNQTAVASGRYTTGAITVKGDANLVASNIKSGVSIFGVNGSYEGTGGGSEEINSILSTLVGITISFTLDGVNYNAEEGMTWTEWLASYYNVDDFIKDSEEPFAILTDYGSRGIADSEQNNQSATDIITHNGEYNLILIVKPSFTLSGITYETDADMTWEEWLNSDYNPGLLMLSANPLVVRAGSGAFAIVSSNGINQNATDVIIINEIYQVRSIGGGGID